ncbi:MAG: LON peptidase substrate-binding domain-containing protein [Nitrospinaceae bacterium]|jgi:Lon protease-like protein|nr:LON peptidase substrate-binding domain-containing protein [Nitrospinaceae bacterium]MBT3433298.1 LON peptidase substrate-binding domain-containing protein [Nitrospinaceae bacterium]MBT3821844.1 LON peptidase substrate-binding domain-containing protein [Nitrospinaceae bacterium]MBT4092921.1 LON peptidase substrate-binding domain-containing protein [Nitrospinaceae bacterium]MBT4429588.1 LON peptidase substrate-binding domain-containing protein [Nitrospinaceae bacterium]
MTSDSLPLFPLRVVLLPDEILPLHIFEERYKEMINECLDHGGPFGVVLAENNEIRNIGCAARVTNVLERFPDGKLNIMTQGKERFRILHPYQELAYMTADVEYFDDPPESEASPDLAEKIIDAISDADTGKSHVTDEIRRDFKKLSFRAGAMLGLSLSSKQMLLESVSPDERAEIILEMLEESRRTSVNLKTIQENDTHRNGHQNGHFKK